MTARRLAVGVLSVLATLWLTAPALPARVAVHFDFAGRPNRWTTPFRAAGEFTAGILAILAIFGLAAVLLERLPPRWVNIPHRDEWLAPPHRAATVALLRRWLAREALAITVFFGWLWAMLLWAHRQTPVRLSNHLLLIGTALWLAVLAADIIALYRRFARSPSAPATVSG